MATLPYKGQTSVLRFVRSPETAAYTETLCKAFGISGFCNVQFVLDEDGRAYLLELNRRIVTHMHMGERVGADLAVAMARQVARTAAGAAHRAAVGIRARASPSSRANGCAIRTAAGCTNARPTCRGTIPR